MTIYLWMLHQRTLVRPSVRHLNDLFKSSDVQSRGAVHEPCLSVLPAEQDPNSAPSTGTAGPCVDAFPPPAPAFSATQVQLRVGFTQGGGAGRSRQGWWYDGMNPSNARKERGHVWDHLKAALRSMGLLFSILLSLKEEVRESTECIMGFLAKTKSWKIVSYLCCVPAPL